MRKIVYYVALSIDGFIAGSNEDVSGFVGEGNGVEKYLSDLKGFDTVIMGRKTYEFGYRFGLKAGELAYPHMTHHIFSNTMQLSEKDEKLHIHKPELDRIHSLKQEEGTDIYLCGGGVFAGWLLDNELIDILRIKLNPLILGDGIPLFGESEKKYFLDLISYDRYEKGLQFITYKIGY